jgi:hypothetical protein
MQKNNAITGQETYAAKHLSMRQASWAHKIPLANQ